MNYMIQVKDNDCEKWGDYAAFNNLHIAIETVREWNQKYPKEHYRLVIVLED